MWEDTVLVPFLKKFDEHPFLVKTKNGEYRIGEGESEFTVRFNDTIPLKDLMTSTSLALGEAYMDGYDIGNDFYKLWLDETLSYSCAYFLHDDDTLYQAQVNMEKGRCFAEKRNICLEL